MALRTFHFNPSLGGFGGDQTPCLSTARTLTPDAFCQIIKELVDNAVDACITRKEVVRDECEHIAKKSVEGKSNTTKMRVRVVIERFQEHSKGDKKIECTDSLRSKSNDSDEILRVTVSDTGCGMRDIHKCVSAFHTSKAHASLFEIDTTKAEESDGAIELKTKKKRVATGPKDLSNQTSNEGKTGGRYGIGLTLCLLHAQRLVPNSCASIRSATSDQQNWSNVLCVVDAARDSVHCVCHNHEDSITSGNAATVKAKDTVVLPQAKSFPTESGTAISILIPGGEIARNSWPRLAEYFARFKLCLDLPCTMEVLASTLSRIPLVVNPPRFTNQKHIKRCNHSLADNTEEGNEGKQDERRAVWKSTSQFLGREINIDNVSHSVVPIRCAIAKKKLRIPVMKVSVVVAGPYDDSDHNEIGVQSCAESYGTAEHVFSTSKLQDSSPSASLQLVRMINNIPMLDTSEASACGLVQNVAASKRMWNSFGLEVNSVPSKGNVSNAPTYIVRDSDQIAPFFNARSHKLLATGYIEKEDDVIALNGSTSPQALVNGSGAILLPAAQRLGNILIIAQIQAEPSILPLPTLSKGRLPVEHVSIDRAFDAGLLDCLKQLQRTNPGLLLTSSQIRKTERDLRYVPAVAFALSSIISRSKYLKSEFHNIIFKPRESVCLTQKGGVQSSIPWSESASQNGQSLNESIEGRMRSIIYQDGCRCAKQKKKSSQIDLNEPRDETEEDILSPSHVSSYAAEIDWSLLDDECEDKKIKTEIPVQTRETNGHVAMLKRSSSDDIMEQAHSKKRGNASVITPTHKEFKAKFDDWL